MLFADQHHRALDVVCQVHQADLHMRPRASDGADADAAHIVGHRPENMLHPHARSRFLAVGCFLLFRQRAVARPPLSRGCGWYARLLPAGFPDLRYGMHCPHWRKQALLQ